MTTSAFRVLIVGAGAAGYFAAIRCAELNPTATVEIVESAKKPLQKVRISGGGRCNVTQGCFDIATLLKGYPRGAKELRGALHTFQPRDTVEWFESRGVKLKREDDGRMFPVSNMSQSVLDCFENERRRLGVSLLLQTKVTSVIKKDKRFLVQLSSRKNAESKKGEQKEYDSVLIATGSSSSGYELAQKLDHSITKRVPSLFTFQVKDPRIEGLAGVSVQNAEVKLTLLETKPLVEEGPLLITHWGFSGPAVIKLSAWGAKDLFAHKYKGALRVSWLPASMRSFFVDEIAKFKKHNPKKQVYLNPLASLPKSLWQSLCSYLKISKELKFAELSKKHARGLEEEVFNAGYQIDGKGVFKEEFVTCGGIELKEVDFRTMESKCVPKLYFAGEILNIDGITGGYNFQSAWTTAFIAGSSISL